MMQQYGLYVVVDYVAAHSRLCYGSFAAIPMYKSWISCVLSLLFRYSMNVAQEGTYSTCPHVHILWNQTLLYLGTASIAITFYF